MAEPKFTRRRRPAVRSRHFHALLGQLFNACTVIETATYALENGKDHTLEAVALRQGVMLPAAVYDDLDLAICRLPGDV